MIKSKINTFVWPGAVALMLISQLLILSISKYPAVNTRDKAIMIVTDVVVGMITSLVIAFVTTSLLALISYGNQQYRQRFVNELPILLIIIELIHMVLIQG
jgi:hypothetical protein